MADDPRPEQRAEQRIAKLLARAGVASRREVERMIAEGRVALNGQMLDTPATLLRSLHGVTVDGQPVAAPPPARLFLFHKPPGLLTTERDPGGRPTIYDRLPPDLPRLVPVGRLDLATEGLLLLTTDGGLKRQLELPATGVERAYRARAYGDVTQAQLEELIEGVEIEGVRYGPIDANLERRTGANVWIELILTEGKNREVRRVLEHLGLQVSRLIRTRYGPFVLGDLQPGEVGEVRQHDLVAFRKTLGMRNAPAELIEVEAGTRAGRAKRESAAEAPARERPPRPARSRPAMDERDDGAPGRPRAPSANRGERPERRLDRTTPSTGERKNPRASKPATGRRGVDQRYEETGRAKDAPTRAPSSSVSRSRRQDAQPAPRRDGEPTKRPVAGRPTGPDSSRSSRPPSGRGPATPGRSGGRGRGPGKR